jgi:hypothetical protein
VDGHDDRDARQAPAPDLSFHGIRQQRSRSRAQNLGKPISKASWLRELENVSVHHGVSTPHSGIDSV